MKKFMSEKTRDSMGQDEVQDTLKSVDPIINCEIDIISHCWWQSDGKLKVKVSCLVIVYDTLDVYNIITSYPDNPVLYILNIPTK